MLNLNFFEVNNTLQKTIRLIFSLTTKQDLHLRREVARSKADRRENLSFGDETEGETPKQFSITLGVKQNSGSKPPALHVALHYDVYNEVK